MDRIRGLNSGRIGAPSPFHSPKLWWDRIVDRIVDRIHGPNFGTSIWHHFFNFWLKRKLNVFTIQSLFGPYSVPIRSLFGPYSVPIRSLFGPSHFSGKSFPKFGPRFGPLRLFTFGTACFWEAGEEMEGIGREGEPQRRQGERERGRRRNERERGQGH